jgi:hypothetical protein
MFFPSECSSMVTIDTAPIGNSRVCLLSVADSKQIDLRCRWETDNHGPKQLNKWVEKVVTQHVEDILGIPTQSKHSDFRYISVRDRRSLDAVGIHNREEMTSPRSRSSGEEYLKLVVTVRDGHAIFVDVHSLAEEWSSKDDVVIHSIEKVQREAEPGGQTRPCSPGHLHRTPSRSSHAEPLDSWRSVMELTSL